MEVYDPIYGQFFVPPHLKILIEAPEVRRLSQVRLLNTLTPSLATLGELRRYSHTLGVLRLSQQVPLSHFSVEERRALEASILIHDVGTPPFGHLFEYHLHENAGWNHEDVIRLVLDGTHAPENRAHQIYLRRPIRYARCMKMEGISVAMVEQIVGKKHPLSQLLFGTLDLDNLDNVARMAWALGLKGGPDFALPLAGMMEVTRASELVLDAENARGAVEHWLAVRRRVYDVLVFDAPTVAAQAVLSAAIGIAMESGLLTSAEWSLSDEELLDQLSRDELTKDLIVRFYVGQLPTHVYSLYVPGGLADHGFQSRKAAVRAIEESLSEVFPGSHPLGYVFVDRRAFEKRLTFTCPRTHTTWEVGHDSVGVVYYGFLMAKKQPSLQDKKRAAADFLMNHDLNAFSPKRIVLSDGQKPADAQQAFKFSP